MSELRQTINPGRLLEDQLGDFTVEACRSDPTVKPRLVRVEPKVFWALVRRTNAKIFVKERGESMVAVSAAGVFDVVSSPDVEPMVAVWEFEPRTPGVSTGEPTAADSLLEGASAALKRSMSETQESTPATSAEDVTHVT